MPRISVFYAVVVLTVLPAHVMPTNSTDYDYLDTGENLVEHELAEVEKDVTGLGGSPTSKENVIRLLRERCRANMGLAGDERAMRAVENAERCVKVIDVHEIKDDVTKAMQARNLKPVFRKHCSTTHTRLDNCFREFSTSLKPCLSVEENEYLARLSVASYLVIQFVCLEDGEQVQRLLTDGGGECFVAKHKEILACDTDEHNGEFISEHLGCERLVNQKKCIMQALQACQGRNFFADMFDHVLQGLACDEPDEASSTSRSSSLSRIWLLAPSVVAARYL